MAARFPVTIDGQSHETCCRGCQAVAQSIALNGLAAYYRNRIGFPVSPRENPTPDPDARSRAFAQFDLPQVQRGFVRDLAGPPSCKEAALLLDGVTCGACGWLIEQRLGAIPGVQAISVNLSMRRARVRWEADRVQLSALLHAIADLGYAAQPYDAQRAEEALAREGRDLLWRMLVAGLGMMQVMMYAVPVYLADGSMTSDIERLMRIAGMLLTLPVVVWGAMPFYRGALRKMSRGRLGMDTPVSAGILIAFGASTVSTFRGTGEVYFDSTAMFVFLLLAARWLELGARGKAARTQERLARLTPAVAERYDAFPGTLPPRTVPSATLVPGDCVLLRPGARIPADGTVIQGAGAADESLLSGESRPVPKGVGDRLTGGAVNLHNPLVMRVDRVGEATALSGILRLMDRAHASKPRIALLADRVAAWFVALQLALTMVVAMVWYAIDAAQAIPVVIALLVVTCPCAVALAIPVALTAATGTLHGEGMLITSGSALETLSTATHVVFDKTGTLTDGRMALVGVITIGSVSKSHVLDMAAALEAGTEHPIGRAIVAKREHAGLQATAVAVTPGCGVEGRIAGRLVRIGTPEFVRSLHGRPLPAEWLYVSDAVTAVALGDDEGWMALLTFEDTLRADARRVVHELHARGKIVWLLSGDHRDRVAAVAHELGIKSFRGGVTPQAKLDFVRELQRAGAVVAMIGDGVNDAPVLAQADVSVALAEGTDLAQRAADLILTGGRLAPVLAALDMAERTRAVIRQNLVWAVAYNLVVLPLAATGGITPLWAAAGMSASSMIVVLNALRLASSAGAPELPGLRWRRNHLAIA